MTYMLTQNLKNIVNLFFTYHKTPIRDSPRKNQWYSFTCSSNSPSRGTKGASDTSMCYFYDFVILVFVIFYSFNVEIKIQIKVYKSSNLFQ